MPRFSNLGLMLDGKVEQNWDRSKDFDETFTVAFYNCGLQFDTSSKPFRPLVHRKQCFKVIKPEKRQNGQNCPKTAKNGCKWLEMDGNGLKWMEMAKKYHNGQNGQNGKNGQKQQKTPKNG